MPETMKQQWERFAKAIGLASLDFSDTQYLEMRMAFYAGALSILNNVVRQANEIVPEEQSEASLRQYFQELNQFHTEEIARRKRNQICRG